VSVSITTISDVFLTSIFMSKRITRREESTSGTEFHRRSLRLCPSSGLKREDFTVLQYDVRRCCPGVDDGACCRSRTHKAVHGGIYGQA